jgi:hypothetical protein
VIITFPHRVEAGDTVLHEVAPLGRCPQTRNINWQARSPTLARWGLTHNLYGTGSNLLTPPQPGMHFATGASKLQSTTSTHQPESLAAGYVPCAVNIQAVDSTLLKSISQDVLEELKSLVNFMQSSVNRLELLFLPTSSPSLPRIRRLALSLRHRTCILPFSRPGPSLRLPLHSS